jgi:hypothetical protein
LEAEDHHSQLHLLHKHQFVREAPGIEERKIELMDIARQVAQQPINLPAIQVSPLSGLEQQGMTAAGQTGVGVRNCRARYSTNSRCSSACRPTTN